MLFTVSFAPAQVKPREEILTVVIDILRAGSTICKGLQCGALSFYPVKEISDAYEFRKKNPKCLLAGEREGKKIPGFDLGNSPLEYVEEVIKDKDICLCTTNGTKVLSYCHGKPAIIASFLNFDAVVSFITPERYPEIHLACSGQNGAFGIDDVYFAGLFINSWTKKHKKANCRFDSGAYAALSIANYYDGNIERVKESSFHAMHLKKIGFIKDVDFCFTKGNITIVPKLEPDGYIRI